MKRFLALIAAVLICIAVFSGCNRSGIAGSIKQKDMPADELNDAILEIEYSALSSVLYNHYIENALMGSPGYRYGDNNCCIYDYDGDGRLELISLANELYFDRSGYSADRYERMGTGTHYIGADGAFYSEELTGQGYYDVMDGVDVEIYQNERYVYCYENSEWITALNHIEQNIYRSYTEGEGESELMRVINTYYVYGNEVSEEAYTDTLEELGLKKVETTAIDFISNTYDAAYSEVLLTQLSESLERSYGGYSRQITDVDSDGRDEMLILLPNILDKWSNHQLDIGHTYSVVLVADEKDGKLTISAYAAGGSLADGALKDAALSEDLLKIDGKAMLKPTAFESLSELKGSRRKSLIKSIAELLPPLGYKGVSVMTADVADASGDELICFAKDNVKGENNQWVFVIAFNNGIPTVIDTYNSAYNSIFSVELDGKQYIMLYNQYMDSVYVSYSYTVLRYNADGAIEYYDEYIASAETAGGSAATIAQFFKRFNRYFSKAAVLCDPYMLQGNMWSTDAEYEFGDAPAEPEREVGQLGYVEIKDPTSWLNLRVGPGTDYELVLMDLSDEKSFVRQAQGSPVTILETIETGDKENPVWVKVRITYAESEYIGYSSKSFIRLASEQ